MITPTQLRLDQKLQLLHKIYIFLIFYVHFISIWMDEEKVKEEHIDCVQKLPFSIRSQLLDHVIYIGKKFDSLKTNHRINNLNFTFRR
jgi:hypothetical protein